MSDFDLTQIKARPGEKTDVRFFDENSVGGNGDYDSKKSADPPRPELYNAMNALVPFACETLGLPESYGTGMEIVDVKVCKRDEGESLIIKFTKTIDDEEEIDWSPRVPQVPVESAEVTEIVNRIREEASLFVQGKRVQQELAL